MTAVAVLGCRVDVLDVAGAVARVMALASGDAPAVVVTLGTEMVVRARYDVAFRDVVNASALSLCDTIGVLVAARLAGAGLTERVSGIDIIDPIAEACERDGIGVYLIGGKGETAAVAAAGLRKKYPRLIVAGTRDGYFPEAESAGITTEVARSGARILFLGLGSPRQEIWLARHLKETGCTVGIGVGGSLDVLAGNVSRAPLPWRRLHLEWLYRLIREPKRWRRQLALPKFVALVVRERATAALGWRDT